MVELHQDPTQNRNMTDYSSVSLPFSTSKKDEPVRIRMESPDSGFAGIAPTTMVEVFDSVVKKYGDKPALHQKVLKDGVSASDTAWTTWTWSEYRRNADAFAKSLLSLNFQKHDAVNIIGFNAPEWHFANFGAVLAGGISAGIYATNLSEACFYVSDHSEARVVVVEGTGQLEKFYPIAEKLKKLEALVVYGPDPLPDDVAKQVSTPVYKFDDFLKLGEGVPDSSLRSRADDQKPNETTTLIYTSGTTGPPKAVMLTHDNITWTARAQLSTMGKEVGNDDHVISYLPLSHIAAQMLDMHCAMATGLQVWFAQPDALKGSLGATLKDVRPTVFFGVPRVWEKIYDKMQQVAKGTTGLKKMVSTFAKEQASDYWKSQQYGSEHGGPWFYPVAQVILGKVREALGLDRCFACYVGAAPLEVRIIEYFASIDIPIYDVFGQSECCGPHASNNPGIWKIGTVGRALPGTASKLDPNTGELIYSGRHIFAGYMNMPDKTEETVDPDGFLHSGDVVKIDGSGKDGTPSSGFIRITGRIKELIITAGGENVPPVLIEDNMKAAMPALSNGMVVGDKRKFLTVLFCLQVEVDAETGVPTNRLASKALDTSKEIGSSASTTDEARECDRWKKYFDEGVEAGNAMSTSRAQKIAKWSLLPTDFSEPGGEFTPTLKLKRSVAQEKYSAQIEALYA